jgi:secondary thiamine-phosphate synthase enzyme
MDHQLTVHTHRSRELVDITEQVAAAVRSMDAQAVLVYVPHTTAGVIINEHADPDVARDILVALDQMVPDGELYRHVEGNSAAHVKASLVGTSQMVAVEGGRLVLGRWQGIFFAEFDGPRTRTVHVVPISAGSPTRSE